MNVDQFYRFTHLFVCIITIIIILNIWYKYYKILEQSGKNEKMDFSLIFFVGALIIWEINLYDGDIQFESLSGTIAISFLILGFNFIELNLKQRNSRRFNLLYIVIVSLFIICISRVLYAIYPEYLLYGFSIYFIYLTFGFIYSSIKAFIYFKDKKFLLFGYLSIILFAGLLLSILGSAYHINTKVMFEYYKSIYLISTFGLLSLLITLSYVWINSYVEREYSDLFSDIKVQNMPKKNEILEMLMNDKINEAIENIIHLKKEHKLSFSDVYLIAARNKRLENKNRIGILSFDEFQVERNKILSDTIAIVEDIF